jgi:hypothetical protein
MRACVIVLGVIAACEAEKSTSAPEMTPPPTADEIEIPAERAPQTTQAKKKKLTRGTSRWDAPATLGHLKSTSPSERKQIDGLVKLLIDPQAGRDSLDAKQKLAAIGKPAFPVILGAMAKVRDTIGDTDTIDERLIESSLKLADECLREIDGYLTAKQKATIRPGTDRKYIVYIIRLHYRRWTEVLQHMADIPGPYDPAADLTGEITWCLRLWIGGKGGGVFVGGPRAGRKLNALSTLEALFSADKFTIMDLPPVAWTLIGEVPAQMKKERESRAELGPLLVRGLDHEDLRLQTLARDCLRVLYEKTVGYNPHAPLAHRQKRIRRWREVVEVSEK